MIKLLRQAYDAAQLNDCAGYAYQRALKAAGAHGIDAPEVKTHLQAAVAALAEDTRDAVTFTCNVSDPSGVCWRKVTIKMPAQVTEADRWPHIWRGLRAAGWQDVMSHPYCGAHKP